MSPIVWRTGDRQMTSWLCGEVPEALTEPMECTGTHSSSMAIHTHYPLFRFGNPRRATYSSGVAKGHTAIYSSDVSKGRTATYSSGVG